jgi:hypothetical protein
MSGMKIVSAISDAIAQKLADAFGRRDRKLK